MAACSGDYLASLTSLTLSTFSTLFRHPLRRKDMQIEFRTFQSSWSSWEELFQEAAEFAAPLGKERLISISHSADQSKGVVTVWYWSE